MILPFGVVQFVTSTLVVVKVGPLLIVTGRLIGFPTHPLELVSTTRTLPAPEAPQFTVILLVFPPLACVPPVMVQVYVLPGVLITLYATPEVLAQTEELPVIAEVVGSAFTVMLIEEAEAVQGELLMVQVRV